MSFNYNILIVDDTKANIESLKAVINSNFSNINVYESLSAKDGFDILYENKIDLILLDIQMPEMDGYEFAKILSQNADTKMIPIVFVTAVFTSEDFVQTGLDLGAIDYITKPIDTLKLVKKLKLYMKLLEKQKSLELALDIEKALRKEIEEQQSIMIHQNKLTAMGELLSNIAHQWRQPLNILALTTANLKMKFNAGILDEQKIEEIETKTKTQVNYLSDTIDDFRDFFSDNSQKEYFKISDAINTSVNLIKPSLDVNNIDINYDMNDTLEIKNYKKELSQVIINIINNAVDIIEQNKIQNPNITIKTLKDKNNVVIKIGDNGGGISEDILLKVFEPYFTTKFGSRGTGLGLFMSKAIIEKNMGGYLSASNDENGAIFTIELPL